MFGCDGDELADDEVGDAVGEIANMTGGNLKSLLGGSCHMSLPSVTIGNDYTVNIPGSAVRDRSGMTCDGHNLLLTILEQS
jgi:chemotaxis protein CheX